MQINFSTTVKEKNLVFYFYQAEIKNKIFDKINDELDGYLSKIIEKASFKGKADELILTFAPNKYNLIMIKGLGPKKNFKAITATKFGGKLITQLNTRKIDEASIIFPDFVEDFVFGARLKNYNFNKYKSEEEVKKIHQIKKLEIITTKVDQKINNKYEKIADSVHFVRDLITEPPNIIYPESMANIVKNRLAAHGVDVEILDEEQMKDLGMGALLGVGQASCKRSKIVVMHYNGDKEGDKPLAFIGKGVTFDSGGLSIKLAGMEDMKYDMAGSAVIVGVINALAARKAKVNAVGVIGLAENMVGGNSQRPSDVVKTMSGKTVEVLNTDAEGRLVLSDVLWYCQNRFKPKLMIDVATLTGAITVALGTEYAGLFSNNDNLSDKLYKTSIKVGEKLWKFPMDAEYDKELISDIADMRNIAISARAGGSIVAAKFLERFVNKLPWAHLDIAGVVWDKKGNDLSPKGATAFGVRLLNQFVEDYYEK